MSIELGELRDDATVLSVASSDILTAKNRLLEAADYTEKLETVVKLAAKVMERDPQKAVWKPDAKNIKALQHALHEAGYL